MGRVRSERGKSACTIMDLGRAISNMFFWSAVPSATDEPCCVAEDDRHVPCCRETMGEGLSFGLTFLTQRCNRSHALAPMVTAITGPTRTIAHVASTATG